MTKKPDANHNAILRVQKYFTEEKNAGAIALANGKDRFKTYLAPKVASLFVDILSMDDLEDIDFFNALVDECLSDVDPGGYRYFEPTNSPTIREICDKVWECWNEG